MNVQDNDALDLRELLRPLWTRWPLVLAIIATITAGTYLYYASKPKQYTASTQIFVKRSIAENALSEGAYYDETRNTINQATLVRTRPVAEEVAKRIRYEGDPTDLLGDVETLPAEDSDFVTVTATQGDPRGAAVVANGFAEAFIRLRSAELRDQVAAGRRLAERELRGLPATDATLERRQALRSRIQQLRSYESLPTGTAQQVDRAVAPSQASAPKPLRNTVFAFGLAVMLALALAFLLDRFDRRLRRVEDVEAAYGQPLFGILPHASRPSEIDDSGRALLPHALKEPVRSLRMNLQLAGLELPVRTVLVTSALPSEGKTTIARNLALAFAETGARVALVDADLRRPAIADAFNIAPTPGLTEVLTGSVPLEDALRRPPTAPPGGDAQDVEFYEGAAPYVLTSGTRSANPPVVLASARMQEVLAELSERHDVVILDAPPLLAVSDALPLLGLVDGVVVATRIKQSTFQSSRRALQALARVPRTRLLGVVATDVPSGELDDITYEYYATPSAPASGERAEVR